MAAPMICGRCGWDLPEGDLDGYRLCQNLTKCNERMQCSRKIQNAIAVVTPHDPINYPAHYTQHPSGVECITITEHFNFNVGNAIKYCWRAGLKSASAVEDLKKAAWYINRELERLAKESK